MKIKKIIWKYLLPSFIKNTIRLIINKILLIWKTWNLSIDNQSYYNSSINNILKWYIKIDKTVKWNFNINLKWKVEIGEFTNINWPNTCLLWCYDYKIVIWKFCSVAPNVIIISTNNHNYNKLTITPWPLNININDNWWDVVIWNDVWIWSNVVILPGINIWNWAIIWAWSIVIKNVEPYTIVAWNPAKFIKYRFKKDEIEKVNKSEWWNWNIEKIKDNYNLDFIKNYYE